jgi:SynChlorMet cassette radical SAM/SPASM protein ScmF
MYARSPILEETELNYAPSLTQLYFYLTEGCNLACRHCWLAPKMDPAGDRYPVLGVDRFLSAITEARCLGLQTVKLTGGEPLLHPAFLNLLDIVRREGLGVIIETNGVLVTPRIASAIAANPSRFVSVSLDGTDAETHEWVRCVEGSFQAALLGIEHLVQAGIQPQIIMSLMRINVHQIRDMIRLAEQVGASSVKFNVVQPTARGEKLYGSTAALRVEELVQLGQYVTYELAPTTDLKLHFDLPLAFHPLSSMASGDGCGTCGIFNILGVLPTGHYALCGIGQHIPELVFGEVGVDDLADVWLEDGMLQSLRGNIPDHLSGVCEACLMKHQCLGSCIAQNYYRSGNVTAPYWFCQEAYEMGLFPVSRLQSVPVGGELLAA